MGKSIFDEIGDELAQQWDIAFGMSSRGSYQLIEDENSGIADLYVLAPGYENEDISVEMNSGKLTVKGNCARYGNLTLVPSRLELSFRVSPSYLVESAVLNKGFLTVRLKNQGTKTETVKIPIQSL